MNAAHQSIEALSHDTFGALLGFGPAELGLLIRLAELELSRGEVDNAIETLRVLVDLDPFHRRGWELLSDAVAVSGDSDLAATYREYSKGLSDDCQ